MDWIQTYSGRQFFPLEPRIEDVDIRDIAHALSLLCRFNGHSRVFYSVAEHSVRVSRALAGPVAAWGLLHDAAEAYLSDIPTPIKRRLPEFGAAEDRLLRVIVESFGLSWPMPPDVDEADRRALATEARDLMDLPPRDWGLDALPFAEAIRPWSPVEAEDAFLLAFNRLEREGLVSYLGPRTR